jgi:hypothetical protein
MGLGLRARAATLGVCAIAVVLVAGCTTVRWGSWTVLDAPSKGARTPTFDPARIDCAGPSSCLALGLSDQGPKGAAWDGTTWRFVPNPNVTDARALSCATERWCYAVWSDMTGVWDGTAWSTMTQAPYFDAISCPVAGTCFGAVTNGLDAQLYRFDGAAWTPAPGGTGMPRNASGFPTRVSAMSCSSVDTCTMLVSVRDTTVWRWHAGAMAGPTMSGSPVQLTAVDCPSENRCVMVGSRAFSDRPTAVAAAWSGSDVTARDLTANGTPVDGRIQAIDCLDDARCVATGPGGTAVLDGSGWQVDTSSPSADRYLDFACVSAGRCFGARPLAPATLFSSVESIPGWPSAAGGRTGLAAWDGGGWSNLVPTGLTPRVQARFTDVSCPLAAWCLSVGSYVDGDRGKVMAASFDGERWTQLPDVPLDPDVVPSDQPRVDCATTSACVVAINTYGTEAVLALWNGTSWALTPVRPPTAPPSSAVVLDDVACGGPSACLAIGSAIVPEPAPVSGTPFAVAWDGTSWSARAAPAPAGPLAASALPVVHLTCATPSYCARLSAPPLSVPGTASVRAWNGTTWTGLPDPLAGAGASEARDIDCPSATSCVVTGRVSIAGPCVFLCDLGGTPTYDAMFAATWNGYGWVRRSLPGASSGTAAAVSCASANACLSLIAGAGFRFPAPGDTLGWESAGATWSLVTSPAPPSAIGRPAAVSCSRSTCQVVGDRFTDGAFVPIAYRVVPPAS